MCFMGPLVVFLPRVLCVLCIEDFFNNKDVMDMTYM